MTMAAFFLAHPEVKHGDICIAFTPDEEVGNGVEYFDVPGFGADFAYTVKPNLPTPLTATTRAKLPMKTSMLQICVLKCRDMASIQAAQRAK